MTSGSSGGVGFGIERDNAAVVYSGAAAPADWAGVSAEDARTVYGKSAFIITDNTFDEIFVPWQVNDAVGSDFTATSNKATMIRRASAARIIQPSWKASANTFPIDVTISKICVVRHNSDRIPLFFRPFPIRSDWIQEFFFFCLAEQKS